MIVDLDLSDHVCPLHRTPVGMGEEPLLPCGCPRDDVLSYLAETSETIRKYLAERQQATNNNGAAKNNGRPPKPTPILPCFENIPDELKVRDQWVDWRYQYRFDKRGKGKWTKPPYQPDGNPAEADEPKTWSSFQDVRQAYERGGLDGVGFELSANDPDVAFDFDHVVDDAGNITDQRVADYVARLNSYTELTPSRTGLRVIARGKLPGKRRKKGNLECYDTGRYVTLTGQPFPMGSQPLPIANRQAEIEAIHADIFSEPQSKILTDDQPAQESQRKSGADELDDTKLLEKARAAKNSSKFAALFDTGNWQGHQFSSASEADLSLCCMLAFWTNRNRARIDSLFRQSALMRGKWNREDYREHTLDEAIRRCKEVYRKKVELLADDSMLLATEWAKEKIEHPEGRILHRWQSKFWRWNGACYVEDPDETIRTEIWHFLRYDASLSKLNKDGKPKRVSPNIHLVNETLDALKAHCQLPTSIHTPCWLTRPASPSDGLFIPVRNGLLRVSTRELIAANPNWFDFSVINAPYNLDAQCPQWEAFLNDLWPDDQQSRNCLQEIFGYLVSGDTSQQKSFMIVGPPRSGKGTIARVGATLMGPEAVVRPALADFNFQFGLEALINKSLAIISDARLGNALTAGLLVERLLAISGEDSISVPRKYLPNFNGELHARFLILTNELPVFADPSGALPSRFILLKTSKSYLGHEDPGLFSRLATEMPGILNWALDGWERIQERGHFVQPETAREMAEDLAAMANPLGAFIEEACEVGPKKETTWAAINRQYVDWCEDRGVKPDYLTIFARNLRAALPHLTNTQPHGQKRTLVGVAPSSLWRVQFQQKKTQGERDSETR